MKFPCAFTALVALAVHVVHVVHALPVGKPDAPGLDLTPKYSPLENTKTNERRWRSPSEAGVPLPPQQDNTMMPAEGAEGAV
ncbi:hypothetical protein DFH06DRAFT_1338840 [Mycena polygramma]|nr:hypothetical protein DFH06DRAFT_1338840 [Mycena polygramma]